MDGHHAGISGESQQTQALQGILTELATPMAISKLRELSGLQVNSHSQ